MVLLLAAVAQLSFFGLNRRRVPNVEPKSDRSPDGEQTPEALHCLQDGTKIAYTALSRKRCASLCAISGERLCTHVVRHEWGRQTFLVAVTAARSPFSQIAN